MSREFIGDKEWSDRPIRSAEEDLFFENVFFIENQSAESGVFNAGNLRSNLCQEKSLPDRQVPEPETNLW